MPGTVRVGDHVNLYVSRGPDGYVTAKVTVVTTQDNVDCVYYNPDRVTVAGATRATTNPPSVDQFRKNV